jgi:predicted Zn-dependent protease
MLLAAVLALGLARPSVRVAAAAGLAAPVPAPVAAPEPVAAAPAPGQTAAIAAARKLRFDDAVSRLRTLRHQHPRDAEVARALGDLYGTRNWTNAAMDAYRDAVRLGAADEALATRVAAMLDSRSQWAAAARLLREIGAPAIGPVTQVAQHDRSPTVRARAKKVLADL